MKRFFLSSRLKAIKKANSDLIGKFTIKKKFESNLRAVFLRKFFGFSFHSHLETSHFSYLGSVNEILH